MGKIDLEFGIVRGFLETSVGGPGVIVIVVFLTGQDLLLLAARTVGKLLLHCSDKLPQNLILELMLPSPLPDSADRSRVWDHHWAVLGLSSPHLLGGLLGHSWNLLYLLN